jgi:hypothetical protein
MNNNNVKITTRELVDLCAVDDQLYCRTFFPKTYRQDFPVFHDPIVEIIEEPNNRYVGLKMYRGSAKTTRVRTIASKRIAYAISNVIVIVGNAQKHAGYSLKWLRKQIIHNRKWADTFQLSPGATFNDDHIEVIHGIDGRTIHVVAFGITGSIRGINLDDFRPDFIIIDDPDNEETTNTPEQREKTSDLVFGALQKSLAPPTENPMAKMVLMQTPFNPFDLITTCEKSPEWHVPTISCFDESGKSTWESRYPTPFLQKEKDEHARLRKMALWMREMECKIVAAETAAFDMSWLKYWDQSPGGLPLGLTKLIAIDPASSESKNADDQVVGLLGFKGRDIYLIDYTAEQGEMPEACASTTLSFMATHRPYKIVVESVAYQRVLAWFIRKAMTLARRCCLVEEYQDRRRKSDRIIQAMREPSANGHLWCKSTHTKFIEQYTQYRPGVEMRDDVIDMAAIGISAHRGDVFGDSEDMPALDESNIPDLDRNPELMAP